MTWTGSARLREKTVFLCAPPASGTSPFYLDLVDIDLLAALAIHILVLRLAPVLVELEIAVALALLAIRVRLVNLGTLGQLAVGLQASCLVGTVLEDDVAFLILVVAQREQDDVALVDPDLLAELASDVCEPFRAVEAEGLEASVSKHFQDLGIFWGERQCVRSCVATREQPTLTFFLEGKFTLLVVILVLSTTAILASLFIAVLESFPWPWRSWR